MVISNFQQLNSIAMISNENSLKFEIPKINIWNIIVGIKTNSHHSLDYSIYTYSIYMSGKKNAVSGTGTSSETFTTAKGKPVMDQHCLSWIVKVLVRMLKSLDKYISSIQKVNESM